MHISIFLILAMFIALCYCSPSAILPSELNEELSEILESLEATTTPEPEEPIHLQSFVRSMRSFPISVPMEKRKPSLCFCCRAFICQYQRCPCSKFIF